MGLAARRYFPSAKRNTLFVQMVFLAVCTVASQCHAEVQLAHLFSDHMVLQRDLPIHLWGMAEPGEQVHAQLQDASAEAVADDLGRWSVYLPSRKAGGPFEVMVRGKNEIHLQDVMIGDVWVASGQSNMEFGMQTVANSEAELRKAGEYDIRVVNVGHAYSEFPLADLKAGVSWAKADANNLLNFSAVAYLFARRIEDSQHVPVGIIESSWGGTPAEAWTSMRALTGSPELTPAFAAWAKILEGRTEEELRFTQSQKNAVAGQKPAPAPRDLNAWHPAYLFNAMIAPVMPLPIKGVLWYQGEANTADWNYAYYAPLFRAMIEDWRAQWKQGDFPFLFVQIANVKASSPTNKWAEIREAQMQTLTLKNTGMAVTADIGEAANVHPRNKQDVADRLARAARKVAYGEEIESSGPIYRSSIVAGDQIKIWFDHGEGLMIKDANMSTFEVAGADKVYHPATASIENGTLILRSPDVPHPVQARYAWLDNPTCTLYNAAGLPASPFRTR